MKGVRKGEEKMKGVKERGGENERCKEREEKMKGVKERGTRR